ncbi:MAG: hypothetical protein M3Z30_07210 [Gemmatimonadota bacterium]|nr:hypothetical protein [Gemmatimonadota bacterium]
MPELFGVKVIHRRLPSWVPSSALALLALSACGNVTNPFADEGRLQSIAISGNTSLTVGDTVRLSARGKVGGLTGLFTYDRVLDAVWSVSDPGVASIVPVKPIAGDTTSGSAIILTGLRVGNVTVTAAARGVHGSALVHITPTP